MERETIDQSLRSDREINAARTPAELREAVHNRRLIRARLEFEAAMEAFEQSNPLPAFTDRFNIVIR